MGNLLSHFQYGLFTNKQTNEKKAKHMSQKI
jgi:hypothetical protein